jgi:hypothetical protein
VTDELPVSGEKPETLFLGLYEEEFVKRVFVRDWAFEFACGVLHGHRQKSHVLSFDHGDHGIWIEGTLALAGRMMGTVLQTHLPDGHSAHKELSFLLGEELAFA